MAQRKFDVSLLKIRIPGESGDKAPTTPTNQPIKNRYSCCCAPKRPSRRKRRCATSHIPLIDIPSQRGKKRGRSVAPTTPTNQPIKNRYLDCNAPKRLRVEPRLERQVSSFGDLDTLNRQCQENTSKIGILARVLANMLDGCM